MECLRNEIGILGCDAPTPTSGIYVNSLPGITSFLASKIASNEQITFLGVWNDAQARALRKFQSSVISAYKTEKKYRIKTIAQMVDLGRILDTTVPSAASAQYKGFTVEIMLQGNRFTLQSALQVIYIQEISLWSDAAVTGATLKIFDLDSGAELDSFTQDLVSGWNTIRVAQSYDSFRIFVAYDATNVTSTQLQINSSASSSCQACCNSIFGAGACEAWIYGAASNDLADPTAYSTGNDSFGLSGIFSIQCRYDWIVCGNKELFLTAWQNLLGAELLSFLIHSNRINGYTQPIAKEDATKYRDELLTEFDKELAIAINGIDISSYDCCIECVAPIQKPYLVP